MAKGKSTFIKQAAILAAAGLLVRFIGFIYRLPMTNLLGDVGNTIYSVGYSLYTFFLILTSAGLPAAISKMVSERIALKRYNDARAVFRVAMTMAVVMGLAGAIILSLGAKWFANMLLVPESYYSILTLAPTLFIVAVMAVFRGYFQGMNNTVPTAISQVVEQIFNGFFSVYLAYAFFSKGLPAAAAGGTAGTGIGAFAGLLTLLLIYSLVEPVLRLRYREPGTKHMRHESRGELMVKLLKIAFPIIAGTAIFSMTNLIDLKMALGLLQSGGAYSPEEAKELFGQLSGKYVVLTTLPISISASLATAVIPSIAASAALRDRVSVNHKINMALRLSMIISIPAAVGMGVLSEQILKMLFPSYPNGAQLLRVGSISIVFLALAQIVTGVLQGIGKVRVPAMAAFAGALFKIPLNYLLIPIKAININGAILSTIACYMMASFIDLYFLNQVTKIKPDYSGVFIKPLASSAVMGLGCYVLYYTVYYLVPSNTLALLIAVFGGVCLYFGFMLIIDGIRREDVLMVPMGNRIAAVMERVGL